MSAPGRFTVLGPFYMAGPPNYRVEAGDVVELSDPSTIADLIGRGKIEAGDAATAKRLKSAPPAWTVAPTEGRPNFVRDGVLDR